MSDEHEHCAYDPNAAMDAIIKRKQAADKAAEEAKKDAEYQKEQRALADETVRYLRSGLANIGWIDVDDPTTLQNAAQLLPVIVKLARHMVNATTVYDVVSQPPTFTAEAERYMQYIETLRRTVEDQQVEFISMQNFAAKDDVEIGV